jgi:hypothetical protein
MLSDDSDEELPLVGTPIINTPVGCGNAPGGEGNAKFDPGLTGNAPGGEGNAKFDPGLTGNGNAPGGEGNAKFDPGLTGNGNAPGGEGNAKFDPGLTGNAPGGEGNAKFNPGGAAPGDVGSGRVKLGEPNNCGVVEPIPWRLPRRPLPAVIGSIAPVSGAAIFSPPVSSTSDSVASVPAGDVSHCVSTADDIELLSMLVRRRGRFPGDIVPLLLLFCF